MLLRVVASSDAILRRDHARVRGSDDVRARRSQRDEIESLSVSRASSNEPSEMLGVVNTLLTQIDRLKSASNVLILSTSNLIEIIDEAILVLEKTLIFDLQLRQLIEQIVDEVVQVEDRVDRPANDWAVGREKNRSWTIWSHREDQTSRSLPAPAGRLRTTRGVRSSRWGTERRETNCSTKSNHGGEIPLWRVERWWVEHLLRRGVPRMDDGLGLQVVLVDSSDIDEPEFVVVATSHSIHAEHRTGWEEHFQFGSDCTGASRARCVRRATSRRWSTDADESGGKMRDERRGIERWRSLRRSPRRESFCRWWASERVEERSDEAHRRRSDWAGRKRSKWSVVWHWIRENRAGRRR